MQYELRLFQNFLDVGVSVALLMLHPSQSASLQAKLHQPHTIQTKMPLVTCNTQRLSIRLPTSIALSVTFLPVTIRPS